MNHHSCSRKPKTQPNMKASQSILLCAALSVFALPSCSSTSSTVSSSASTSVTRVPVSSSPKSYGSMSDQVFRDVNAYRASKGKKSLYRHAGLDRLAQKQCDYLVKKRKDNGLHDSKYSHKGFGGRASMGRFKFQIGAMAENVVSSSTRSANHLVDLWAKSRGHQKNMVGQWACTGVGTATTPEGTVISVQLFGSTEGFSDLPNPGAFNGFR